MKKGLFVIFTYLTFHIPLLAQLNCYPKVGDVFFPIEEGVNLRAEPYINSSIILTSPDDEEVMNKGIRLVCVEDGFINDFVKVKVMFWPLTMGDYGINPEVYYLYEEIKENYSYDESFKLFYQKLIDTTHAIKLYSQVKNDEWFKDRFNSDSYDMSTFENFYNFWIKFKKNEDGVKYILDNHERVLFAHKSVIESSDIIFTYSGVGADAGYYLKKLKEFQDLESESSCRYSSAAMYSHLEKLVDLLIQDEKYFEAIKWINQFQHYFKTEVENYQIDFLKMQASYFDQNIKGALGLSQSLISGFKEGKFSNSKATYFGDIDMSKVYGYAISCLLKLERFEEGLLLSNECLKEKNLQYSQYIEFHAMLLGNLGKVDEACVFLNDAYMKGNEGARELYLENCK